MQGYPDHQSQPPERPGRRDRTGQQAEAEHAHDQPDGRDGHPVHAVSQEPIGESTDDRAPGHMPEDIEAPDHPPGRQGSFLPIPPLQPIEVCCIHWQPARDQTEGDDPGGKIQTQQPEDWVTEHVSPVYPTRLRPRV